MKIIVPSRAVTLGPTQDLSFSLSLKLNGKWMSICQLIPMNESVQRNVYTMFRLVGNSRDDTTRPRTMHM